MKTPAKFLLLLLPGLFFLWLAGAGVAGYKSREWNIKARELYAASLSSEGVTIAADPCFTDALAARVFDKKDIVTRGIMPLAIVIFNDNDYPVEVDVESIELIRGEERHPALPPEEAVNRVFGKERARLGNAANRTANEEALKDFSDKCLKDEGIAPHGKAGGFLYFRIYNPKELPQYLSTATLYIPNVYRGDIGSRLIYFEIELKPALQGTKAQ
ncbi:MAG: hypothetical protein QUT30_18050 [Acidobacteriota bacterium]|jgi:hypothetical protein|nr:hypothetical protein [Acidobacteriota bacterium]